MPGDKIQRKERHRKLHRRKKMLLEASACSVSFVRSISPFLVEAWCEFSCRPVAKDTGKQSGSQRKPWVSRLGRDLQRFVEVASVFFQFMENLT